MSGTVLSFSLGLFWPRLMGRWGSVIGLPPEERDRLRAAWVRYQSATKDAEKARTGFLRELRRLERRYPQAALARAIGVTRAAIHKRLHRN